jgi:hypothetical protein
VDEHEYIDSRELEAIRADVAGRGFERDPLVGDDADRPYAGLNLAVMWPLPARFEAAYLEFQERSEALHEGLYVYPFATTHVTVLTAVNFKRHPNPTPETWRRLEEAADALGAWIEGATSDIVPFALDIGPPVLARAAAFLPIKNPTREIALLRERALAFCRSVGGILADASAPKSVHSTVVRFREAPGDVAAFAQAFDGVAGTFHLGRAVVDRVLVTLETKPYMRAGSIATSVVLCGSARAG